MEDIIRIVLADDHEIFRQGFKVLFKRNKEMKIVGEASNGRELIQKAMELLPDVIVTDIHMEGMSGIEATTELTRLLPETGIIALSMANEELEIIKMLEAGAKGYLLKNAEKSEIFEAIRTVHNKENYYCQSTDHKLDKMISESRFDPVKRVRIPQFTERQVDIIRLLCKEYSYAEIGNKLNISSRTVEWHIDEIKEKIDARNQAGIILFAINNRIFE